MAKKKKGIRKITRSGIFPDTTKATGKKYSSIVIFLDEFGHHYGRACANTMIKKGFPMAKYQWFSPRGYQLAKEWNT